MDLKRALDKFAFGLKNRAAFYADMDAFTGAGIPAFQAIERMAAIARRRGKTRRLANVYGAVMASMRGGESLAKAIAPWAPAAEAVMITGAETAGGDVLRMAFRELATLLDRQQKMKTKLYAVMSGNVGILVVIVAEIFYIMSIMVPALKRAMTPDVAKRMVFAPYYFSFGDFVLHDGWIVLLLAGLIFAAVTWSLPNWTTRHRDWFDAHMPPWSLYKRLQATFFLSTAAAMMRAGITLKSVVADMQRFGSKWAQMHLSVILRSLESGKQEVVALASGMLPRDTNDRLEVYSLIPDFTKIMSRLADDNLVIYEKAIDRLGKVMGTVTVLVFALFLAATLIAIFDFTNAMNQSVEAMRHVGGG